MWSRLVANKRNPLLWVVSGPSGSGKTTLCKRLLRNYRLGIARSVSFTTRPKRRGEKNYRDYIFVSKKDFLSRIKKGEFIEWQEVFGNLYGTSKKLIYKLLSQNKDVLLSIDVQGALAIKKIFSKKAVFIFVVPPNYRRLIHRINRRARETKEEIQKRLKNVAFEFSFVKEYDYVVVNDDLSRATKALESIILAKRQENVLSTVRTIN